VLKDYYNITKPGIIYGNAITVIAGFVLASSMQIDYILMLFTLISLSLIIASGCVFNNYYDRDIDTLMERTKNRPLVKKSIPLAYALMYGALLGIVGFSLLLLYTNTVTVLVAVVGVFVYVIVYTMWLKRTSTHSALVGSISGAVPILVGYTAVRGHIDLGAVIIFLILVLWQMPHAFAIALYRIEDYKAASIPVLPIVRGSFVTKIQMLVYTSFFVLATLSLSFFGYTGNIYISVMGILGVLWIGMCARGFSLKASDDKQWARSMFLFSIIILVIFCILISIRK
jgi:protoheme IX farnesyltransferase